MSPHRTITPPSGTGGHPGIGLGLAIVQAIVKHHGGTLDLASAQGQGTTVRVRLPSASTAEARRQLEAQGAAPSADTEGKDLMPIGVAAPGVLAQGPDGGMQAGEQS